MQERKAIVFNCYYNGLSVIRALGRKGIQVIALDFHRNIGTRSRYAKYIKCPDPHKDERGFIDFLLELGRSFEEKPVIFPTNDIWVLSASKYYKELVKYYDLCFSEYRTVDMVLNKNEFYKWSLSKGISVPGTWKDSQLSEIDENCFPLIVKPENRRPLGVSDDIYRKLDANRMTIVENREQLIAHFDINKAISKYLIAQEYVRGMSDSMYTVGVYANDGNVRAVFTGRKVRGYPADFGDCVVGQIEKVPEDIVDEVLMISRELNYTGIAEFEYKKDSVTGRFRLIEINPRSWSWVGITPECGVNLPLIAFHDLKGEYSGPDILFSDKADGSIKYVKLIEDMKNCLFMYKRKGYPEWHRSIFSWIRSLKSEKLVIAEFEKDDIMPLFFTIFKTIGKLLRV